jgi:hypothetical protein
MNRRIRVHAWLLVDVNDGEDDDEARERVVAAIDKLVVDCEVESSEVDDDQTEVADG